MNDPTPVEHLLSRALEFGDTGERAGFLDLACAGDAGLRRELESLIDAHLSADCFLEPQVVPPRPPPEEHPGDRIGRYRLCEMLGEGGFGRVWRAEQQEPVQRMVALKIVKLGMDTREVLARFKVERQALALMDHPNIARVYDGGATDSGRPYFVMELVNGTPITKYCVDHQLGTRERLELFIDVAAAVQHAHQKGVIHRDLKPSNIMVSLQDGRPVVKVIDFGIAKAVSMELTGTTVLTVFGRMIGTPEYMSPEQAELSVLDVDTRSDIYALGVLLYELLTGTTPLDPAALRKAGFTEMQRMIREEKPLKPTARIAALRQQGCASGSDALASREIDWVVMQALEKDRSRRYQTANGLAMDVRRFLDDEPVSASPPSATYRIAKFAKRHRAAAAWTIVFMTAMLMAAIGMTLLYFDSKRKEEEARKQAWEALIAEAAALRWSGKPARRFQAFAALRAAAAMPTVCALPGNEARLRDSVIACLAIVDMQPLLSWKGNPGYGEMVAADPALGRYAILEPEGGIALYRFPSRDLERRLPGGGRRVENVLRFSPDGSHLAAAYGGPSGWQLKLWPMTGEPVPRDAGTGIHKAFAFFPDGTRCAVARPDGSLAVIEVATARLLHQFPLGDTPLTLAVSRSGDWLAASFGTSPGKPPRIEIRNAATGAIAATLMQQATPVAWSPNDDSLAAGGSDGIIRLWHDENWEQPPASLEGHIGMVEALSWSPDGRLLASQGVDGNLHLWDPIQGAHLSWHPGRSSDLAFSADGKRLAMIREGETLTVMEVAPGDVCYRGRKHAGDAGVFDGAWNRPATLLATSGDDGVGLWNREGRQLAFLKIQGTRGVAFSGDALFVASLSGLHRWPMTVATTPEGTVLSLHEAVSMGEFADCGQIALHEDASSSLLAMPGRSKDGDNAPALWLFDLKSTSPERKLAAPDRATTCAISPDGRWLAAGTTGGEGVRVWNLADLSTVVDLPVRGSARVAFSPHSGCLLTGDTESYRLWEAGTWTSKREFPSQMANFSGLMAFSPRPTALIVACRRAELKVLNPFTLEVLSTPDFDRESPLCFDPTGRLMITTGQTGGLFFWKLDALRARLKDMKLDWTQMPEFTDPIPPVLSRVIVPPAGN